MLVTLTLKAGEEVVEEKVELPINRDDDIKKIMDTAKKWVDPKNAGRPKWDPFYVLLRVKM
jgi:hypothetical protein